MSVGQPVSTMLVVAATTPVRLSMDVFRTHDCVMLGRQDNQPTLAAGIFAPASRTLGTHYSWIQVAR